MNECEPKRDPATATAKVIQVIEVREVRGTGVPDDPFRMATAYFSFDGTFLADQDPFERSLE